MKRLYRLNRQESKRLHGKTRTKTKQYIRKVLLHHKKEEEEEMGQKDTDDKLRVNFL